MTGWIRPTSAGAGEGLRGWKGEEWRVDPEAAAAVVEVVEVVVVVVVEETAATAAAAAA